MDLFMFLIEVLVEILFEHKLLLFLVLFGWGVWIFRVYRPRLYARVARKELWRLREEGKISQAVFTEVMEAFRAGKEQVVEKEKTVVSPPPPITDLAGPAKEPTGFQPLPSGQPVRPEKSPKPMPKPGIRQPSVAEATPPAAASKDAIYVGSSRAPEKKKTPVPKPQPGIPLGQQIMNFLLDERTLRWMLNLGAALVLVGAVFFAFVSGRFWLRLTVLLSMTAGLVGLGTWVFRKMGDRIVGRVLIFTGSAMIALDYFFLARSTGVITGEHLSIAGFVCTGLYLALWRLLKDKVFAYAWSIAFMLSAWLGLWEVFGLGSTMLLSSLGLSAVVMMLGTTSFWGRWARDCGEGALLYTGLAGMVLVMIMVGPLASYLPLPEGHIWKLIAQAIDLPVFLMIMGLVCVSLLITLIRSSSRTVLATITWLPLYAIIWAIHLELIQAFDRLLLVSAVVSIVDAGLMNVPSIRNKGAAPYLLLGARTYSLLGLGALLGLWGSILGQYQGAPLPLGMEHAVGLAGMLILLITMGLIGWPWLGLVCGLSLSYWLIWQDGLIRGVRVPLGFLLIRSWWIADQQLGKKAFWTSLWKNSDLQSAYQVAGWAFLVTDIGLTMAGTNYSLLSWWASIPVLVCILPWNREPERPELLKDLSIQMPASALACFGAWIWWGGLWDGMVRGLPDPFILGGVAAVLILFPVFWQALVFALRPVLLRWRGKDIGDGSSSVLSYGFPIPWISVFSGIVILALCIGLNGRPEHAWISFAFIALIAVGEIFLFMAAGLSSALEKIADAKALSTIAWLLGGFFWAFGIWRVGPWDISTSAILFWGGIILWGWSILWMLTAKKVAWQSHLLARLLFRAGFLLSLLLFVSSLRFAVPGFDPLLISIALLVVALSFFWSGYIFPSVVDGWLAIAFLMVAWWSGLEALGPNKFESLLRASIFLPLVLALPAGRVVPRVNERVWRGLGYGLATAFALFFLLILPESSALGPRSSGFSTQVRQTLLVVFNLVLFAAIFYRECWGGGVLWVWTMALSWLCIPFYLPVIVPNVLMKWPGWMLYWIMPLFVISVLIRPREVISRSGKLRSLQLWRYALAIALVGSISLYGLQLMKGGMVQSYGSGNSTLLFLGLLLVFMLERSSRDSGQWRQLLRDYAVPFTWIMLVESLVGMLWLRFTDRPYLWGTGALIGMGLSLFANASDRRWIYRTPAGQHFTWLLIPLMVFIIRGLEAQSLYGFCQSLALYEWALILASGWFCASMNYRGDKALLIAGQVLIALALWGGTIAASQLAGLDPSWFGVTVTSSGAFLSMIWVMGRTPAVGWTRERWIQPVIEPALIVASSGTLLSLAYFGSDQVAISAAISTMVWIARAIAFSSSMSAWISLGMSVIAFGSLWVSAMSGLVPWPVGGIGLVGFYFWWVAQPKAWVPEVVRSVYRRGFGMAWTVFLVVLVVLMFIYAALQPESAAWSDLAIGFLALVIQAWIGSNLLKATQLKMTPFALYLAWFNYLFFTGQSIWTDPDFFLAPVGVHLMFLGWQWTRLRHFVFGAAAAYKYVGVVILLAPICIRAMIGSDEILYPLIAVLIGLWVAAAGYAVSEGFWIWMGVLSSSLIIGYMVVTRIEWQGGQWALVTAIIGVIFLLAGTWLHQRLRHAGRDHSAH